eukprot:104322-Chlamydomonas_euryale.AAC.1
MHRMKTEPSPKYKTQADSTPKPKPQEIPRQTITDDEFDMRYAGIGEEGDTEDDYDYDIQALLDMAYSRDAILSGGDETTPRDEHTETASNAESMPPLEEVKPTPVMSQVTVKAEPVPTPVVSQPVVKTKPEPVSKPADVKPAPTRIDT